MQEIALLLSSFAGVATAAAVKKFPKNKAQLVKVGASPQIKNQLNSLHMEKEILTKTISRLYQSDAGLSKIQRDRLLLKYQHQLGIILAKIDKLDAASKHPDFKGEESNEGSNLESIEESHAEEASSDEESS